MYSLTASYAAEVFSATVVHAPLTADPIAERMGPKKDWMAVHFSEIAEPMAVSAVEIAVRIASHTARTVSLQFCQMNWNGRVMIWNAALKTSPISMMPT